jgi:hypothetical protein
MFHIVALIVALNQSLVYSPNHAPLTFDTKEACTAVVESPEYAAEVQKLQYALIGRGIPPAVTSTCEEVEPAK